MVVWGFEIGDSEALLQAVRHLRFRRFCIKIIIKVFKNPKLPIVTLGVRNVGYIFPRQVKSLCGIL